MSVAFKRMYEEFRISTVQIPLFSGRDEVGS